VQHLKQDKRATVSVAILYSADRRVHSCASTC